MATSCQSGKNWEPIAFTFNNKTILPSRMDSNQVGQVLLCKDVKNADCFCIPSNIEPFEHIVKEYPLPMREIGQKISLLHRILLSVVSVTKDI